MGYMKVIGDTINQGQYLITGEGGKMTRGIRCLAICSWGYIRNKELLINKDSKGFNHASYKTSTIVRPHEPVSLNGDHTHFLLVDNGMRGTPTGAAELRAKLEERIADPGVGGLGIPVILLILEGGLGVIVDVLHSLRRGIPVVVIRGTGRAADIIAFAQCEVAKRSRQQPQFRSATRKRLKQMLEEAYNKSHRGTQEELHSYVDKLEECMEFVDLINVFDLNSEQELDAVILNALMKESGITEDSLLPMEPLQLALMWDRLDMAEKIFSGRHDWPPGCLDDMLTETLLSNKVDFFNLLVLNVVFLKDYLNVRRLRLLYNLASSARSSLRRAMERLGMATDSTTIHLRHVDRLLTHILRRHEMELYDRDDPRPTHRDPKLDEMQFQEPWDELFLWAVLNCRQLLARHVWTRTSSPVTFAVIATAIYRHYYDSTSSDNNHMRDMFEAHFVEFKKLSVELIHVCYERNSLQAVSLAERRQERLGDMSVTLLAMFADNRAFLATPCSYESITQTWMGAIRKASSSVICLAIFCPLLVWTRAVRFLPLGDSGGELGPFQKLLAFYKAPFTKLIGNAISYAAFLVLYTYMILFDFRFEMQLTEKIVIFWIFTMCLDVLRQITTYPSETLQGKLADWIASIWNKFDFLTLLLALLAFCLRMFTITFPYGRIAYSLNTCILYIRAFRFYHIVFKLGPKLVILYRMIDEVFNFMLLLVVFILGYGVAAQALLYPVRPFYLYVFKDIFMVPYWQMYGELQLETTEAPESEVCYDSSNSGQICEDITHYAQVVPPMLAIFLLIGNVMLLNLLIAVFTNVFEKVRENSTEIWKYEMFRLVKEYEEKPGLAPPLIILELIWVAAKKTWKVCCRRRKENLKLYLQRHLANLAVFERECMAYFLQREKEARSNQTDEKLARIEERLASMAMQGENDLERVEDILMAVERNHGGNRPHSRVTLAVPSDSDSDSESPQATTRGGAVPSLRLPSAHARIGHLERRLANLSDELSSQRVDTERLLQRVLERLPPPAAAQHGLNGAPAAAQHGSNGFAVGLATPDRSRSRALSRENGGEENG
ncbi:transient receptor potential cation channel subfamily M member 5-like isoform X1 [Amphibalanus amphitrite]|uniref:transient receptor potential cation channel subfamily M member 5-like isoform X1 n=1 Tax=Amphibalanus amphitrite TaxID=1232801 RepID=UPI001C8FF890|nr:transient receptor potential cation channel subfamily M member 5-like isoform X1 [Amphibalanus amphitrite]